ncbi:hypothetical protein NQ317_012218 [Molorchus minor]|uniref:Uncharacterized protein n=1 Tax=Molorchus minor TaxID=1323400 RepID=A0ABQ9ISA1_9CUCU|nr:hypothetical protein NQ317_012218 [Molorchus minor]
MARQGVGGDVLAPPDMHYLKRKLLQSQSPAGNTSGEIYGVLALSITPQLSICEMVLATASLCATGIGYGLIKNSFSFFSFIVCSYILVRPDKPQFDNTMENLVSPSLLLWSWSLLGAR